MRYCAPGYERADYLYVMRSLFGKTVPTPVSSRWHGGLLDGGDEVRVARGIWDRARSVFHDISPILGDEHILLGV